MAVSKFASYGVRLQTLRDFPCRIDIHNVAKAGLYYNSRDNTGDTLRCAFCEFVVANWTGADDPWELHAAFVPMCIHVLSLKGLEFVQNVLHRDGCCGEESASAACISLCARFLKPQDLTISGISGHLERKQNSASVSPSSHSGSVAVYRTYRGAQFKLPVNLDMQDEKSRAQSFTSMDRSIKERLNLKVLAAAGFYFTGQADSVKCYHCGEGFKNWKRRDDPWVEHARYAPLCMHVILTKGEEFVERIQGELERDAGGIGRKRRRSERLDYSVDDDDSAERDQLISCFKCGHRRENRSTADGVVTLCSHVWVCESCNKHDRQCPVCVSS